MATVALADAQGFRVMPAAFESEHVFCLSCRQKKVQLFEALLAKSILYPVPHRHFVFGIPLLRPYFRYDRDLLEDLCRVAHECLIEFLRTSLCPRASPASSWPFTRSWMTHPSSLRKRIAEVQLLESPHKAIQQSSRNNYLNVAVVEPGNRDTKFVSHRGGRLTEAHRSFKP